MNDRSPIPNSVHQTAVAALLAVMTLLLPAGLWAQDAEADDDPLPFILNLADYELGALPDDGSFLSLDGEWTIVAAGDGEAATRYLQIPGNPVRGMGLLIGPDVQGDVTVSATVVAEAAGRRKPRFGVGVNGADGFILRFSPVTRELELLEGEKTLATVKIDQWKSGDSVRLTLTMRAADGQVSLAGHAAVFNPQVKAAPTEATISATVEGDPWGGQAVLYGAPYANLPIRYHQVSFTRPIAAEAETETRDPDPVNRQ